jgi:hypothetical protein
MSSGEVLVGRLGVLAFSDDRNTRAFFKQADQGLSEQTVLNHQVNTNRKLRAFGNVLLLFGWG